ncbi:MBL fold metallo-hydrolase [Candidatus Woesearchaeota archaeon]|nr:MBL fold metallo-hydrolase [Candidatus Woesearchaeota archaeon]MBW2978884.1 MBL fold metallo-hydrolase [Candidatus Woesearchaeota archaeon]
MDSGILFLGTSGEISVTGKQLRSSGGIIIKTNECQFLIDPGPGTLNKANEYGINLRENTAVILTHSHMNHCNDINAVIASMTHNGLDTRGVIITNSTVMEQNIITPFHQKCTEKIITTQPNKKIGIENIEIHTTQADHDDPETIGLKIYTPKFQIGYTSDTKYTKEIAQQYKKTDILIINCVYPEKTKEKQLTTEDAIKLIKIAKPKLAILTHFSKKMLSSEPIYIAREMQKKLKSQVIAAEDGMHLDPISYSAQLKQKTLNLYRKN